LPEDSFPEPGKADDLLRIRTIALSICIIGIVLAFALGLVITGRSPSNDGDWKQEYARLPQVAIDSDIATITDLRNFSYNADGSIAEATYEERSYDLSGIETLWYGISHFADFGLAHTFLSFGFSDGRYLVLSIEARQTVGQSYHPLNGLIRAYGLTYIYADERDIIGLRTHIRGERVFLYKVESGPGPIRELFLKIAADANALIEEPKFYNTLTDNCTTSLFQYRKNPPGLLASLDYRMLLPGYSDELLFDEGVFGSGSSLQALRKAAWLDPARIALEDPAFSEGIRSH
jgi:hypothetical protein